MAGPMENRIREKLEMSFSPLFLEVENESHRHSVPRGSETHFKLVLVSERFSGLSRVARGRLIHETLASELTDGVHALSHRALSPREWQAAGESTTHMTPPCKGARE